MKLDHAIHEIRTELQAVEQRADQLRSALASLEVLTGTAPVTPKKKDGPSVSAKAKGPTQVVKRSSPKPKDAIGARDRAILQALVHGPRGTQALAAVLPDEPDLSPGQRKDALSNALTRLKVKDQIRLNAAGTWELAR